MNLSPSVYNFVFHSAITRIWREVERVLPERNRAAALGRPPRPGHAPLGRHQPFQMFPRRTSGIERVTRSRRICKQKSGYSLILDLGEFVNRNLVTLFNSRPGWVLRTWNATKKSPSKSFRSARPWKCGRGTTTSRTSCIFRPWSTPGKNTWLNRIKHVFCLLPRG